MTQRGNIQTHNKVLLLEDHMIYIDMWERMDITTNKAMGTQEIHDVPQSSYTKKET